MVWTFFYDFISIPNISKLLTPKVHWDGKTLALSSYFMNATSDFFSFQYLDKDMGYMKYICQISM